MLQPLLEQYAPERLTQHAPDARACGHDMLHSAAALIGNRPGRASDARATVAHPGDAPMWSARRAAARAAMSPSPSRNERRANASPPRSGRGASEGHRPSSLIRFASADTFSALSSRIVRSTSAVDDALGMRDNAQEDDEPRPTYTFRQAVWFTFEEASFSTLVRALARKHPRCERVASLTVPRGARARRRASSRAACCA